jgi:hypothetical protein
MALVWVTVVVAVLAGAHKISMVVHLEQRDRDLTGLVRQVLLPPEVVVEVPEALVFLKIIYMAALAALVKFLTLQVQKFFMPLEVVVERESQVLRD